MVNDGSEANQWLTDVRRKIIGRPMAVTEAEFPSLAPASVPAAARKAPAPDAAGTIAWASIAASGKPSAETAPEASPVPEPEVQQAGGTELNRQRSAPNRQSQRQQQDTQQRTQVQQQQQERRDALTAPAAVTTAGANGQDGRRSASSEDDDMAEMLSNLGIATPGVVPGERQLLLLSSRCTITQP